jgi:hypothetical protein
MRAAVETERPIEASPVLNSLAHHVWVEIATRLESEWLREQLGSG